MAAKYILKQAGTKEEMNGIMDVIWAANYTPYEPFVQIFFPVTGIFPAERKAAIVESKARFWDLHQEDPSSNWFYVEEIGTGQPVGCAQWQLFLENPFPTGPPKLQATWWPETEDREFCEQILNQIYKPRASWMTRPHLALNWMAVIPTHRRLGVGSLLMQHGIKRADSLSLECWLEASAMGRPLYEQFGFQSLFKIAFDTTRKNATDVWRKCEHEMTPAPFHAMWRPKQGVWEEEAEGEGKEVKMPWELGKGGKVELNGEVDQVW
ncbi:uncharacterized protein BDR25DRAFT_379440 [Lindgomyces ingoldianus]|uniref:Uncharacterized protein n=1 Tax=Lindgomyces ingoldianus TaxID=673940 RepID=A0ACB6RBM6_9PLEO|nr:uncharacterized protein BDR25DRAFT_379440 [Lindgomyces ingoldianus]KAF2475866.1 hypothetical protein BDR25DRAFT_379440 [Lindgomyces ingoldianus]